MFEGIVLSCMVFLSPLCTLSQILHFNSLMRDLYLQVHLHSCKSQLTQNGICWLEVALMWTTHSFTSYSPTCVFWLIKVTLPISGGIQDMWLCLSVEGGACMCKPIIEVVLTNIWVSFSFSYLHRFFFMLLQLMPALTIHITLWHGICFSSSCMSKTDSSVEQQHVLWRWFDALLFLICALQYPAHTCFALSMNAFFQFPLFCCWAIGDKRSLQSVCYFWLNYDDAHMKLEVTDIHLLVFCLYFFIHQKLITQVEI